MTSGPNSKISVQPISNWFRAILPDAVRHYARWIKTSCIRRTFKFPQSAIISGDSQIALDAKVYPLCEIQSSLIGRYSYVGHESKLIQTEIGAFCSIAPECIIGGYLHPSKVWVTTSPAFFSPLGQCGKTFVHSSLFEEVKRTFVGNDVWLGYRSIVLAGVRIADGAIVGAGSVVTKDVPPYCIVAGNPARILRKRFEDDEIAFLQSIAWWNWTTEKLVENASDFRDIQRFRQKYLTGKTT